MRMQNLIAGTLALLLIESLAACRGGPAEARRAAQEATVIAQLRSLNTAEASYAAAKNHYACTLTELAESPGLVDTELSSGQKNGYSFSIHCTSGDRVQTYQVWANPIHSGEIGMNLYCTDQTGVIRQTGLRLDECGNAKPVE